MSIITIVRTETIILVYTDDGKEEIEKVEEKKTSLYDRKSQEGQIYIKS